MRWVDTGYSCHKAEVIKDLLNIHLTWQTDKGRSGYKVTANGSRSLKNLFGDITSAKAAGEKFAKKLLKEAQEALK